MEPKTIKTVGYLVWTLSVFLPGVVSWASARENPTLFLCLLVGMAASILGMVLRWMSYQIEERQGAGDQCRQASSRPA